jgi:hypothetical protein
LSHPQSPVKIDKLLELIKKPKSRYRLSPDGRFSFTPKQQEWEALVAEVVQLLHSVREPAAAFQVAMEPIQESAP